MSPRQIEIHIWNYTSKEVKRKIKEFKKTKNSILNIYCAEEYELNHELKKAVEKISNSENINIIFGSAEQNFYKKLSRKFKIHLWDNHHLFKCYDAMDALLIKENYTFNSIFISLNNRSHFHRCLLIDTLYKKKLFEEGVISWHNVDGCYYRWKFWTPKLMKLDDGYDRSNNNYFLPKEFNHAFLDLVAESTVDTIFITEKTWKPILLGKPFLVLGAPGFHQSLKNKGFKLFEEIFDYSFDYENNIESRTSMLVDQIDRLRGKDLAELQKRIEDKLYYNRNLALDMIKNKSGVPNCALQFSEYSRLIERTLCKLGL